MPSIKFFKTYFLSLIAFIILDALWLGFVVRDFNLRQLSEIARIENGSFEMYFPAAAGAYLLMALGMSAFVAPRTKGLSSLAAFAWGALMGLVVYGIFDLTNLAILKNYPVIFVAADMAWGTFVFGLVALLTKEKN